jgi:hypothetical protein
MQKSLLFIIITAFIFTSFNTIKEESCSWGTPSLKNAEIDNWSIFSNGTINYSIKPICPKCGKKESTGLTSGLSTPTSSQYEKRYSNVCCWNDECRVGSNCYKYEYGFSISSTCN